MAKNKLIDEKKRRINKDTYHYFKELKICVRCHSEYAENDRTSCYECNMKIFEYNKTVQKKYKEDSAYRENILAWHKQRRRRLKEAGICQSCGKRPAREMKSKCPICTIKAHDLKMRREGSK